MLDCRFELSFQLYLNSITDSKRRYLISYQFARNYPMTSRFMPIAIALFSFWPIGFAGAQESENTNFWNTTSYVIYSVGFGGTTQKKVRSKNYFPGIVSQLEMISTGFIERETEVTDEQLQKLSEVLERLKSEHTALIDQLNSSLISGESIEEIVVRWERTAVEEISEILLPHQLERLREISARVAARRSGLRNFLMSNGSLSEKLTPPEKTKIWNEGLDLGPQIKTQIAEMRQSAIRRIIQSLSIEQQAELKNLFGNQLLEPEMDFEVLLFQLLSAVDDELYFSYVGGDEYSAIEGVRELAVGSDGVVVPQTDSLMADFSNAAGAVFRIKELAQNSELFGPAEFTQRQLADIDAIIEQTASNSDRVFNEFKDELSSAIAESDRFEILSERTNAQVREYSRGLEEIKKLILPHQEKVIEEIGLRTEYFQTGIANSLLRGRLGKRLDVSESQKKRLKSLVEKLIGELRTESIEVETEVIETLFSSIENEKANLLKKAFGEPLRNAEANLDFLAEDLMHIDRKPK